MNQYEYDSPWLVSSLIIGCTMFGHVQQLSLFGGVQVCYTCNCVRAVKEDYVLSSGPG